MEGFFPSAEEKNIWLQRVYDLVNDLYHEFNEDEETWSSDYVNATDVGSHAEVGEYYRKCRELEWEIKDLKKRNDRLVEHNRVLQDALTKRNKQIEKQKETIRMLNHLLSDASSL